MNTQRRTREFFTAGAMLLVALLFNVLVIAPAFHQHGPLHNARACPICTVHATGTVAPPVTPALPDLVQIAHCPPNIAAGHPRSEHRLTILVRGPPVSGAHLI